MAAHCASKTTRSAKLRARSDNLFKGKPVGYEAQFLIPSFCIAEVFAVFEKYRWGRTWNKQVSRANTLTPTEFSRARNVFRRAIHNGATILQHDLNRYHILCVDLVSPINNAYKIVRSGKNKKSVSPASTYDMLVLAMGIWLQHQVGSDNLTIVTGDERIRQVVSRAKSVSLSAPMKSHLQDIAANLGLTYGPALYPEVLSFTRDGSSVLNERLPWSPAWT